jgi:cytoskeleton protein RodZ
VLAPPKLSGNPSDLPEVAASGANKGHEVVAFKASAASWVEVTDSAGAIVLRKTLAAGETAQVGGTLPLKAVVGRADVTEVTVRGQRFELQTVAKDNVARFEVK